MESLEVVDVFCTASECATTFTSNFSTISIFIIFHFFLFLYFLILTCEMLARNSWGWVLDYFLDKTWSYLLQTHFVLLNSKNSSISVDFCIFAQNNENQALSLVARSSSGWVLMTLKVLSSKSSWSQDYFTYLSCCHISHRSQVTTLFMTKFNSLLSYLAIFHTLHSFSYHWRWGGVFPVNSPDCQVNLFIHGKLTSHFCHVDFWEGILRYIGFSPI